jgi:hypothetical protein
MSSRRSARNGGGLEVAPRPARATRTQRSLGRRPGSHLPAGSGAADRDQARLRPRRLEYVLRPSFGGWRTAEVTSGSRSGPGCGRSGGSWLGGWERTGSTTFLKPPRSGVDRPYHPDPARGALARTTASPRPVRRTRARPPGRLASTRARSSPQRDGLVFPGGRAAAGTESVARAGRAGTGRLRRDAGHAYPRRSWTGRQRSVSRSRKPGVRRCGTSRCCRSRHG